MEYNHLSFLPQNPEHIRVLLDVFQLERSVADIASELKKRPAWVRIPLRGILRTLELPVSELGGN